MFYLIQDVEIDKLLRGELKKGDIINNKKIPLLTWSGEDIGLIIEKEKDELKDVNLEEAIDMVKDALENCECGMCIDCAFDLVRDKYKRKVKQETLLA